MGFRFVSQPFPGAEQVGTLLRDVLVDEAYDRVWFATAWGKRSGLSRLVRAIEALKGRGGRAEAIIGVDEGGATLEGLQLALGLFDTAYVFHDPGARTYHPKIYVVEGDARARAIVGSGNLTRGGLFTNYEAGVSADLDLTDDADRTFLSDVRSFYRRLRGLEPFCKELTEQLIEDLQADPRVVVVSEQQANRERARRRGRGESRTFGGQAVPGLLGAPRPEVDPVPRDEEDDDALVDADEPVAREVSAARPVARWWKRLSASDAHRKASSSNQRNAVTLTRLGHDIDKKTWFRDELFGDHVAWTREWVLTRPRRGRRGRRTVTEAAVIPFDAYVGDDGLGIHDLMVDHRPSRLSDQSNPPTYLNWSSLLPVIQETDFTHWWLELARLDDGTFRLRLSREQPSGFSGTAG